MLVQSNDRLLPSLTPAASAYAVRRLVELGAVVHLGTKATQTTPGSNEWQLSNGTTVTADAAFQVRASSLHTTGRLLGSLWWP